MQTQVPAIQTGRNPLRPNRGDITCIALDENELAIRWGLSVKTLRRWRQEQLGPIYCKLGRRVTYLLHEIEAFERRVSRYSSFARAYQ
ncbi:MAG: DNA-binding protein [Propionivibrio sp.]|nr:DNA-binding protein [Propionivibrio sp.]